MVPARLEDVKHLIPRLQDGDQDAHAELINAVYDQLRAMAQRHMDREYGRGQPGITLQPTALANETWMKLIKQRQAYDNRGHFFAIATKLMDDFPATQGGEAWGRLCARRARCGRQRSRLAAGRGHGGFGPGGRIGEAGKTGFA